MEASPVPEETLREVARLIGSDLESLKSKGPEFGCSATKCTNCGKAIGFYDFVKTASDLGVHSNNFMAKFFLGDTSMEKEMSTTVVCSGCGSGHDVDFVYKYGGPRVCS